MKMIEMAHVLALFFLVRLAFISCGELEVSETGIQEWVFTAGEVASMVLLKNGFVYTPESIGRAHVLLAGGSVAAIFSEHHFPWMNLTGLPVKIIDADNYIVAPGLIDMHVHVTGGGGEMGPSSRTPEASLSSLVEAGITTLVGVLGTDCISRSLENLRVKVSALRDQGLTTFMWSGCYRVPSPTLTGTLLRDLQLIDEVIGAGEIAVSDHRGSWPNTRELLQLVSDARVGGMLSGKAGVVHFHVGSASSLLDPLWSVFNASKGAIPLTQMIPTHISSRGPQLLEAAEDWVRSGGRVDLTSDQEGENDTYEALKDWADRSLPLDSVSISSDAFGSLPVFDTKGQLVKYGVASPVANLNTIRRLVSEAGWSVEQALSLSTRNPAQFLSLKTKGSLAQGRDGDVIVLDSKSLELVYVFAKGKMLKSPNWTQRGAFEEV